jgi:hypothetical protein
MQTQKTTLCAFGLSALLLLFWRPIGNQAVCSDTEYTPAPANYKIEFGEKSFWAAHSHITRTDPVDNEFAGREQTLKVAKGLGINFVRTGFIWRDIQPEPTRWEWAKFDSVVLSARRQKAHLLGVLHAPPPWAFPAHEHLDEWSAFVDSVITHYGDDVADWEIWNEPNIDKFWPKTAPVEGFFEIVKRSYQIIKQKRPQATVLLGGMANQPSAFIFLERLAALGVAAYCDAIAYHPYNIAGEELLPILQQIRGIFPASGSSPKPIWITEYGWSAWRHPLHPASSNALAQLLQYCFQQQLQINRPANLLVLDDSFTAATEAGDLYEPLRRQFEAFGWRADLIEAEGLLIFLQNATPQRDKVVIVPTNKLPADVVAPLLNFIQSGGSVVMLGGVPFPNNAAKLHIRSTGIQDEETMSQVVNRTSLNVNLPAKAPGKNFLADPVVPQEVRYVPLLSAQHQGKTLGDIAALYDYRGRNQGVLIAFAGSLTIKSTKRSVTYHEQGTAILKTALVYLLEGGPHFFIYEFRDQTANTKDKFYGIVENDFRLKDAAQALTWMQQQLGKSVIVRSKAYFTTGALIELENLNGQRFVMTWGREAAARFKTNFMNTGNYTPEIYQNSPADKLLAGIEQQQEAALANVIIWRATN